MQIREIRIVIRILYPDRNLGHVGPKLIFFVSKYSSC